MNTIYRPKTRGELVEKLKEGLKCEVVSSNVEFTNICLDGWLKYEGLYKTYPSKNIGWTIYENKNANELITHEDFMEVENVLPKIGQRFHAIIHGVLHYDCGAYVGNWCDEFRKQTMLIRGITHWQPIQTILSTTNNP